MLLGKVPQAQFHGGGGDILLKLEYTGGGTLGIVCIVFCLLKYSIYKYSLFGFFLNHLLENTTCNNDFGRSGYLVKNEWKTYSSMRNAH